MRKIPTTKITMRGTEGVQILPIVMPNTGVEEGVLPVAMMKRCSRMRTLTKTKTLSLQTLTLSSQISR